MWAWIFPRLFVVIILQYMHTANHYVVHVKLIQCFMAIMSAPTCPCLEPQIHRVKMALVAIVESLTSHHGQDHHSGVCQGEWGKQVRAMV